MKYKRNRPRGNERSEEILRGRIRELEKEIDRLKRHIGSLSKKHKPPSQKKQEVEIEEPTDKVDSCPNCGSPDYRTSPIWSPKGEIIWKICQLCKYREKKVSDV